MQAEDIFSTAAIFFPPAANQDDPNRQLLVKELTTLLDNSQFLSDLEKEKMKKVIPIFGDDVIVDLKQSLIRQNLRYLQGKMAESNK